MFAILDVLFNHLSLHPGGITDNVESFQLGIQLFEDYVDITFALGQTFADLIEGRDDFELLLRPQANVLCYRYAPPDKVADIAWCNAMSMHAVSRAHT